jgi:perosamine synthetase
MAGDWIPWAKPTLYGDEIDTVVDALRSTWISGGPYVDAFEDEIARRLDSPYAIAVSNGTTALHLAFLGLGIGPGDEVIVPGFTFVAAANMALAVGANLVFADVDPSTWLLEPASVARLISPRTRAIVVVHLYGNVADMDALLEIAGEHRTAVVEDAAEAAFCRHKGRFAGTMGDVGTLSFQATKTITTGEGGMVLTGDEQMFRRMLLLRDHGMRQDKRYWHDVVGYNYRLTNLQAALGCAQLRHLDTIRAERARVHRTYRNCLAGINNFQQQVFDKDVDALLDLCGTDRQRRLRYCEARGSSRCDNAHHERTRNRDPPGFLSLECTIPLQLSRVTECATYRGKRDLAADLPIPVR